MVSKCVICGVNLAIVFRKDRLKGSEESISICLFCDMELYNGVSRKIFRDLEPLKQDSSGSSLLKNRQLSTFFLNPQCL